MRIHDEFVASLFTNSINLSTLGLGFPKNCAIYMHPSILNAVTLNYYVLLSVDVLNKCNSSTHFQSSLCTKKVKGVIFSKFSERA